MSPTKPDDLTAVALPVLPAGHRWVIDKNTKYREHSWTDSYNMRGLGISLQSLVASKWRKPRWKTMIARKIEAGQPFYADETLVQCAERTAQEIYDTHVKHLERQLEEESIVGIYEN